MIKNESFTLDLCRVLNRHSIDSACNTPDWVLAEMLDEFLVSFKKAVDIRRNFSMPETNKNLKSGAKLSEL